MMIPLEIYKQLTEYQQQEYEKLMLAWSFTQADKYAQMCIEYNREHNPELIRNAVQSEKGGWNMISSSELQKHLDAAVIGQDTTPIVNAFARYRAGMAGLDKPVGAFLMLGPTGVGKTLTVEALAEALHGSDEVLLKVHCAEYRHGHEVSRLIGAPPGYIGHRETTPRLSASKIAEVRSQHCSLAILLFDEIEKAHSDLWDLLLGALDKGQMHMGDGSKVNLAQAMFFFTSNVGSREMAGEIGMVKNGTRTAEGAARKLFSPEFRNRLTATMNFQPLGKEVMERVVEKEVAEAVGRLRGVNVRLAVGEGVTERLLAECEGESRVMGARPVRRAIERMIEHPVALMVEKALDEFESAALPMTLEVRAEVVKGKVEVRMKGARKVGA